MTSILDLPGTIAPADRFRQDESRVDGTLKTSGQAKYTADFAMPGMLWAEFVPSTVVHAKIRSIDTAEARAIGALQRLGASEDVALIANGRFKLRAAEIGKFLFRRIDDVNEMAAQSHARQTAQSGFDLAQR